MRYKGNHFDLLLQIFSRLFSPVGKKNRPTRQDKPKTAGGTIADNHIFKHIPNRIFRYIVYAYICISGVIILMTN